MSGRHPYGAPAYAEALALESGGRALDVPEWSCGAVVRPAPGGRSDAAGPYPRTPLPTDADLAGGLARLRQAGMISVVLVPDPMTAPPDEALAAVFPICRPFKTHHVVEPARYAPSKHHRYEIRRAEGRCRIERVGLADHLETWTSLYAGLVRRRAVTGVAAFGETYVAMTAADPAYEAFAAFVEGRIVAMAIWFRHGSVAVNHLGASDEAGYAAGATYALYQAAIDHYRDCARIDLGGAAGVADDPADGLARFKAGFADAHVTAFLCGAVLDEAAYAAASAGRPASGFFPAYRG